MEKNFTDYLNYVSGLKNYSENTVFAYKNNLSLFDEYLSDNRLAVFDVTTNDIRIFIARLAKSGHSPASLNQLLSTVRGFYDYAVRFKLTDSNPAISVKNIKLAERLPNFLFNSEMVNFFESTENDKHLWPERDKALFTCLYSTGARVSELVSLKICDLSGDYSSAIVLGKGSKERKVFFAEFAVENLNLYLNSRELLLKKLHKQTDSLFINQQGTQLTARGVQYIIDYYVKVTAQQKKITPHVFRHSFASMLLSKGLDIRLVQELLGHESISTTQNYTHITSEQLQKMYHTAHPHG